MFLKGLKVLDLSEVMAGPFCSMMLADMGAEVIKIEEPGRGDTSRQFGPPFPGGESVYYLSINRNKKSITLNLKSEEGKEIFLKLVSVADVLVESFRPGVMEKLGLSYKTIRKINPRLIYASVSAFGQNGPYRDRGGFDLIAQGESGLMALTGKANRPPVKLSIPICDIGTGMYLAYGIAVALMARERDGKGCRIDMALLDTAVSFLTYWIGYYSAIGKQPERLGTSHPFIIPYQAFRAKDSYIIIAVNDRLWRRLCEVLDLDELKENPKFTTNPKRFENQKEILSILNKVIATKKADDLLSSLRKVGVPCCRINTIDKVITNPQVIARKMVVDMNHTTAGRIKVAGIPIKFSKNPGKVRRPPPLLGQHTEEILLQLGHDKKTIKKLRKKSVI